MHKKFAGRCGQNPKPSLVLTRPPIPCSTSPATHPPSFWHDKKDTGFGFGLVAVTVAVRAAGCLAAQGMTAGFRNTVGHVPNVGFNPAPCHPTTRNNNNGRLLVLAGRDHADGFFCAEGTGWVYSQCKSLRFCMAAGKALAAGWANRQAQQQPAGTELLGLHWAKTRFSGVQVRRTGRAGQATRYPASALVLQGFAAFFFTIFSFLVAGWFLTRYLFSPWDSRLVAGVAGVAG